MRTVFITLSAIALLASCSSKEQKEVKPEIVFTNHAEPEEWVNMGTIRETPNAHSGRFVSFIDSVTPYSLGIIKQIKDLTTQPVDSVTISYWAFLKNINTGAQTVCSLDDPNGKNVLWVGNPLKGKVKEANKWVEVKETFKFPANIDKQSKLALYVWNTSKKEILVDDFQITFH